MVTWWTRVRETQSLQPNRQGWRNSPRPCPWISSPGYSLCILLLCFSIYFLRPLLLELIPDSCLHISALTLNSTSLFDRLVISGNANLAGNIRIIPAIGFQPLPGDKFTILTSAQRNGTFNPLISLGGGAIFYVPIYTPTDVILFITAGGEKTWAVDANGNASVATNVRELVEFLKAAASSPMERKGRGREGANLEESR